MTNDKKLILFFPPRLSQISGPFFLAVF